MSEVAHWALLIKMLAILAMLRWCQLQDRSSWLNNNSISTWLHGKEFTLIQEMECDFLILEREAVVSKYCATRIQKPLDVRLASNLLIIAHYTYFLPFSFASHNEELKNYCTTLGISIPFYGFRRCCTFGQRGCLMISCMDLNSRPFGTLQFPLLEYVVY